MRLLMTGVLIVQKCAVLPVSAMSVGKQYGMFGVGGHIFGLRAFDNKQELVVDVLVLTILLSDES
jgi:hypothetical protein